ncbi:MAG TPA: cytochrome c oxidase subunit II [Dehalococcoidia bacterium]|nr:cytochrome c oxidase subunit II [Dehalococcoidia bacterium]
MQVLLAVLVCLAMPLGIALISRLSERPGPIARIRRDSHRTAIAIALALWVVLTAAGVWAAASIDYFPVVLSDKGEDIEGAFRALTIMAVPVAALVVTVLVYGIFRRGFQELPGDAVPYEGKGTAPAIWFLATAALTALVIVYPGLTSLHVVTAHEHNPDLTVKVEGIQWTWLVTYPDAGLENVRELVLPVDRTVTFEVTSRDVLHSFWIPAFLMKIDAVPGLTTRLSLKATETGDFSMDPTVRLQCAELCGLSHASMSIPVRVVSGSEFEAWKRERREQAAAAAAGGGEAISLVAKDLKFNLKEITVAAGTAVTLTLDNQDAGVQHNWALYESERAASRNARPLAATPLKAGPAKDSTTFTVARAGTYFFRCDVHPTTMTGTLLAR